jgi:peptidyl-prolyl cis-trans isomerase D
MFLGVMETMRKSTGVILWVLIFSFGILWMLQTTNVFNIVGRGSRTMGSVNGEPISIHDFQQTVTNLSRRYSQKTGKSTTAEQRANFQQIAWNNMVNKRILTQKMNDLGIIVTDAEVDSMIEGSRPAPLIRREFSNKEGAINRQAIHTFFTSQQYHQTAIAIQEQLRRQRRRQKMGSFIQAAIQVSPQEVKQQYLHQNTTADVSYIRFPYSDVKQSDIKVTTADLKNYYKKHSKKFHQNKSYRFQYVTFSKAPTKQDTARTIKELKDLRSEFASAKNDSSFLMRYQSTEKYNPDYIKKNDVREPYKKALANLNPGEVSPVIHDNGTLYLVKKDDEQSDKVKFSVMGRKIIADPVSTVDKQSQKADDFRYYAQNSSFAEEAKKRNLTVHNGFASKGNTFIAGLGQSRQILNLLKDAKKGEITKPIELPGKFVVINVKKIIPERTQPFDQVKDQIKPIVLANKRKEQVHKNVTKLLQNNRSLKALAKASGKKVQTAKSLTMSDETIPGSGREPEVIGAIFGLKKGELSAPIKGTSAIFVVNLTNKKEADAKNMSDKTEKQIRQKLQKQKNSVFAQVWLKRLKAHADIEDNRAELLNNQR